MSERLLKKGETINNTYEVLFFIGEGAFGEVYRVQHRFLGLQVLKIFKKNYLNRADLEALAGEAKILSGISHENIVRVFETNEFRRDGESHFFLTMGFVSGESLGDRIRRKGRLARELALSIQLDLLRGLVELHRHKLVHRDIYPNNVLLSYVSEHPRALLSDFGLALSLNTDFVLTKGGGNYVYSAPECLLGIYLPASDIFSTGLVLYQMLTGTLPWMRNAAGIPQTSGGIATMVQKARRGDPQPASEINSDVDSKLEAIIERAIALKIENRYQSATQFYEALEEYGQH